MRISSVKCIDDVDSVSWNELVGDTYPFLRHEFLLALETSGSVGPGSGWAPCHLTVHENRALVAVMPWYRKEHSWGEYVFDWSWASAYQRHGLSYYPKLVCAIPFTPATGPRLGIAAGIDVERVTALVLQQLDELLQDTGGSSWHVLFPDAACHDRLAGPGLLSRLGLQYHWHNRGYRCFDDFLGALTARKRKAIRRERRQVAEQGVTIETLSGNQIDADLWEQFYRFYQLTYARRSGHGGYLEETFFHQLGAAMSAQIVLVVARRAGRIIAAALNVRGNDTLFGRYWGCTESIPGLHFEACYYRGIEYCIANGLQAFDAGAQGEHKLQRGFEPVLTRSLHHIDNPAFRRAIADFLREEAVAIRGWQREASTLLPYRTPEGMA